MLGSVILGATILGVRGDLYQRVAQLWSRIVLWSSGIPVISHGMERIDWSDPKVLVSNHVAAYDVPALASVIPGPFSFVAKKELERVPVFGAAWKAAGHISIDRADRDRAIESMRVAARKILEERATVVIYPEGTRSKTGELLPFKKGAFMLAIEAGVPVVPVVVRGSERIQASGSLAIRPQPIHLHFGDPVDPRPFGSDGLEELMAEVRFRMTGMLEREGDRSA